MVFPVWIVSGVLNKDPRRSKASNGQDSLEADGPREVGKIGCLDDQDATRLQNPADLSDNGSLVVDRDVFDEICCDAEVKYSVTKLQKLGVSLPKVDLRSGPFSIESAT